MMRRLVFLVIATLLPFSGCTCQDGIDSGWELTDEFDTGADAGVGVDIRADARPDTFDRPDTSSDADFDAAPDAPGAPVDPWQPEEVEPSVPLNHALTDRTSLEVDPDGTLWLGYHRCNDLNCSHPVLRVTHHPVGGQWSGERVREHEGIFGVSVIEPDKPIVAFPDSLDETYKVAKRHTNGHWALHTFPVERSYEPRYDGFDVTNDGQHYYVSFAPSDASEVSFYSYDVTQARPSWRRRHPLGIANPQAAMERGLRADQGDSVYLVNKDGADGAYGVYRYDEDLDRWPQSVKLQSYTETFVHSLVITGDFELCTSGNYRAGGDFGDGHLLVTCGTMYDLTQRTKYFADESLDPNHPSSIIEGDDGTLYVAFNPSGNRQLRVAQRDPRTDRWSVDTVYDGPSYGVSTAIDKSGDLVISFYTCNDADRCSLKVIWETP